MELLGQMDRAQALVAQAGVDQWELMGIDSRGLTIGVRGQDVDQFVQSQSLGVALRVVKAERVGFGFALGGGDDGLARMVEQALAAAEVADPEPGFGLAGPERLPPTPETCDPSLAAEPLEAKVERARDVAAAAKAADPKVVHVFPAEYGENVSRTLLRTSLGLEARQEGSRVWAMANALASADGQSEEAWEQDSRRFLADLDPAAVGRAAGEKAASRLGAGPVADGRYDVLLTPDVAADFLHLLAQSLLGDNAAKGRSLLAGRLGEQVLSPLITLIDDGLLPRGLGSAACDAEGSPQSRKALIQDGVVQALVQDRLWGGRAGKGSTGNAVRGDIKTPPGVGFTNLFLAPGQGGQADLCAQMGRGLIITEVLGGHTADPVSGQFSFGAAGYLVENGRRARPVKSIALAGQVLELFAAVQAVGGDLRFFGRTGSPSLLVAGLSISG
ncbi:MAG: TldD/PmbA family protein [Thermodesulfobacteriota bacterium]